jgi:D-tyrosyl-tRNA(Tyr) deacylase
VNPFLEHVGFEIRPCVQQIHNVGSGWSGEQVVIRGVSAGHDRHSIGLPQSTPMRIVMQRVSSASVRVSGEIAARIGQGVCLLVGVAPADSVAEVEAAVAKVSGLRIFGDSEGKMNLSLEDIAGEVMVVSQFTLYGDVRRGRRPSFTGAAPPDIAEPLIDRMVDEFRARGLSTSEGVFGARMDVELVNDGPVTFSLEITGGVVH